MDLSCDMASGILLIHVFWAHGAIWSKWLFRDCWRDVAFMVKADLDFAVRIHSAPDTVRHFQGGGWVRLVVVTDAIWKFVHGLDSLSEIGLEIRMPEEPGASRLREETGARRGSESHSSAR